VIKRFVALGLLFALSGCAGQLAGGLLQNPNPSQLSGAAAGVFGIPAATVASQVTAEITEIQAVAASLQMLRAQLDGIPVTLPPLAPGPPVATPPGGPIVTPNLRHRQSRRQQEGWPPQNAAVGNLAQTKFDWSGSTFYFDKEGRTVALK
jgi:hypothetical protein